MAGKEHSIIRKRLARSYLSSVISISLVLLLVGAVCFIAANARRVSDYFKENAIVSVILKEEVTEAQALEFEKQLSSFDFVKSTEFISKERGYEEMKRLLGDDFLDVFEVNPIPFSIDIHIRGEHFDLDSLAAIRTRFSAMDPVREVTYQESLVEMLNSNLNRAGIAVAVVIALLLFISIVLIGNTVRLNVYSKRFTIHTMRMVGASRRYIRRPFMWQALIQGAAAGIIADLLLWGVLRYSERQVGDIFAIFDPQLTAIIYLLVPICGMFICSVAAYFVVNKLTYLSNDDLYL